MKIGGIMGYVCIIDYYSPLSDRLICLKWFGVLFGQGARCRICFKCFEDSTHEVRPFWPFWWPHRKVAYQNAVLLDDVPLSDVDAGRLSCCRIYSGYIVLRLIMHHKTKFRKKHLGIPFFCEGWFHSVPECFRHFRTFDSLHFERDDHLKSTKDQLF